eukprot:gene2592-3129_t
MGRAQSRSLGWSCAQRRLLRALAHALLLYDPQLVIIGDDDTYINYKLIAKVLHPVVNSRRYENPLIVGKLEYMGKISPQGFFHGGGGYIFGKKLVQRLTARKLYDPFFMSKDFYAYYKDLSVVEEVKALDVHCAPGTCVLAETTDEDENLAVGVRLVDLCARLMSGEHTCHH